MDRDDVLIVCALKQETQGQLTEGFVNDWKVLYTGVGKVNATYKLTRYLSENKLPKLVINYGTAGSRNLPIGELVDCTKFVQRDMSIKQLGFFDFQTPFESPNTMVVESTSKFNPIDKRQVCGTGDTFVDSMKKSNLLFVNVVDMEAYALAKVCRHYDVPFISFKYITDNADEKAHKDWTENCSDGIHLFKGRILSKIT